MILPTEELAYKVLKMWNICSEKKRRSIRATVVTLTYENMAKKLKAIYIFVLKIQLVIMIISMLTGALH